MNKANFAASPAQPKPRHAAGATLLTALLLGALLAGCEGAGGEVREGVGTAIENTFAGIVDDRASAEQVAELRQLRYPAAAEIGDDLDILVARDGSRIELANRTPRSYQGMQLWLNRQYVALPPTIGIGAGNSVTLRAFVNRHGETFPVAGVLSPDKGFPVVAAELYDPASGRRHRLTVDPNL